MKQPRAGCAAAFCSGHLYVMGGYQIDKYGGREMFNSVERFDLSEENKYVIKGEWTHMPPLICARAGSGGGAVAVRV